MNLARLVRVLSLVLLLLAVSSFAVAAGVFIRDFGGGGIQGSVVIDEWGTFEQSLYAYELTYDLTVFTTVNVTTVVQAAYYDWSVTSQSNGSLVTTIHPPLPGILRLNITNNEDRRGDLGYALNLKVGELPPELETSLLDPALYATVGLLAASVVTYAVGQRLRGGERT